MAIRNCLKCDPPTRRKYNDRDGEREKQMIFRTYIVNIGAPCADARIPDRGFHCFRTCVPSSRGRLSRKGCVWFSTPSPSNLQFKKKKKMNQFELIKSVESVNTSIASKLMRETLLQSTVGMNCACAICKCAGYFGCRVNLINFNCNWAIEMRMSHRTLSDAGFIKRSLLNQNVWRKRKITDAWIKPADQSLLLLETTAFSN